MKPTEEMESKEESEFYDRFTPRLVGENEVCEFYTDSWTDQFTRNINKYNQNGTALPSRMTVYLCVPKDGSKKSYVAFDTKGKPYMEWEDSWDFEFKLTMVKMRIEEENDIVNIAKRRLEEKE